MVGLVGLNVPQPAGFDLRPAIHYGLLKKATAIQGSR